MKNLLIAAACLLFIPAAHAQEPAPDDRPILLHLAVGQAEVEHGGYTSESMVEVGAEYYFTEHLGVAVGGRGMNDPFETEGLSTATVDLESAWEVALVGEYPINARFRAHASVGRLAYELKAKAHGETLAEDSGSALALGLGARFYLHDTVGGYARAYRAFDVSETDLQWVGVGAFLRF